MRDILIGYGIPFIYLLCYMIYLIVLIENIRSMRRRKKMYDELEETISFTHGLMCDDYETQANKQGCTLGEKAEHFAKMRDAMCRLRMNGYVADSEMDKITKRIHKDLVANLRKLEDGNRRKMTDKTNLYPVKIKIPLSDATAEIALRYKKKPSFFAARKLRKAMRKKYAGLSSEEFLGKCIELREKEKC